MAEESVPGKIGSKIDITATNNKDVTNADYS
jgi:hypothetical protein